MVRRAVDRAGEITIRTLRRVDLYEAVYRVVGLSRAESAAIVEQIIKEITDCLERGETVKLSSFGSFVVRSKGQRIGRNPRNGKEVPIAPRRSLAFKPSPILKQLMNSSARESAASAPRLDDPNSR